MRLNRGLRQMDFRKAALGLTLHILRWLQKNRLSLLICSILFSVIMYVGLPGFRATSTDQSLGTIVLAAGLINFTYWTLMNRQVTEAREKGRIKGRRKS